MSEQRGASVEDDELSAEAGQPTNGSPAESRVPASPSETETKRSRRRRADSDEEDDAFGDDTILAKPSGKRARRKATADVSEDEDGRRPAKEAKDGKKGKRVKSGPSRNPFTALVRFLREVVSELSKVIWPQRRQMISYMVIVMIFVTAMVSFVAGLDIGFAKLTLWLLG